MLVTLLCGILGLLIGSFLNVVALRKGTKSLGGRSACMSCGKTIRWFDNMPVISWLLLRGRCRQCGSRISVQYPIVELTTALLFAVFGGSLLSFSVVTLIEKPALGFFLILLFAILALLIAIIIYDIKHTIIPDEWVYAFAALSGLWGLLHASIYSGPFALVVAGPIASAPLFCLWLVSKGRWMGFGDVKLALGIGWLLGPLYGVIAVFFAFMIGAVFSVFFLLPLPHLAKLIRSFGVSALSERVRGFTMSSEIPFGPFLIVSTLLIWLLILHGIDPLAFFGLALR